MSFMFMCESTPQGAWMYRYSGKLSLPPDEFTEESLAERAQAREVATKRLQEFYDAGVPFFSKETIRGILEQLKHCRDSPRPTDGQEPHIISVPALDGTTVKCELETGHLKPGEEDTEFVVGEAYLEYKAFHQLARPDDDIFFSPELAYCPTRLAYPLERRRISTGEIVQSQSFASVEDAQETFDAGVKAWEESEECKALRELLDATPLPRVTNIVAFACSTISGEKERRRGAIYQHALALTLRNFLNHRRGEGQPEVRCFAQDPIYCKTDIEVLQGAGITVLRDPEGFLEVDDESVVISFYPNVPIREIIADIAKPAVMIWNGVSSEAEAAEFYKDRHPGNFTDPESSRLRRMVENHYHAPFKLGPEDGFGDNGAVYIRRV